MGQNHAIIKKERRCFLMKSKLAEIMMLLSVIAVLISGAVSVWQMNFLLAGTQWILIGIALGIYGIFLKIRSA